MARKIFKESSSISIITYNYDSSWLSQLGSSKTVYANQTKFVIIKIKKYDKITLFTIKHIYFPILHANLTICILSAKCHSTLRKVKLKHYHKLT